MGRPGGCELHACLVGPGTARDPPSESKELIHGGERGNTSELAPCVRTWPDPRRDRCTPGRGSMALVRSPWGGRGPRFTHPPTPCCFFLAGGIARGAAPPASARKTERRASQRSTPPAGVRESTGMTGRVVSSWAGQVGVNCTPVWSARGPPETPRRIQRIHPWGGKG